MRDVFGFVALSGAVLSGIAGWAMLGEGGYLKLLGVLVLMGAIGLLMVALGALKASGHPGIARAATWLFWILVGIMALMTLAERFGGG